MTYPELLRECLTGAIWLDAGMDPANPDPALRVRPFNKDLRREGRDWPLTALTMLGGRRLDHLASCIAEIVTKNITGDVCECGVWRGGAAIFVRLVLDWLPDLAARARTVIACDSFNGFPPSVRPGEQDLTGVHELAVSLDVVMDNCRRYGIDDGIIFVKGLFAATLPNLPATPLALLHLDGDTYDATKTCLEQLYPRVSKGGIVVVDDYSSVPGCREAVEEYLAATQVALEIVDWSAVAWEKP